MIVHESMGFDGIDDLGAYGPLKTAFKKIIKAGQAVPHPSQARPDPVLTPFIPAPVLTVPKPPAPSFTPVWTRPQPQGWAFGRRGRPGMPAMPVPLTPIACKGRQPSPKLGAKGSFICVNGQWKWNSYPGSGSSTPMLVQTPAPQASYPYMPTVIETLAPQAVIKPPTTGALLTAVQQALLSLRNQTPMQAMATPMQAMPSPMATPAAIQGVF